MIPYGRQDINDADIQAVVDVLRSDFLTQGPAVPAFEKSVTDYCGVPHAVAVNSATSALHIACLALDVGPGDHVWTSAITFVASANCALYCGASVDFVDIDSQTYNLSVEHLAGKLALAEKEGNLPKVVIPVHLGGQPCEMAAIRELGKRYGFRIIEDASHAIGGGYRGLPIGDCSYSDIAVFSFHPVKIITSAEGGMAVTKDAQLAKRMRLLRTHGITREAEDLTRESDGPWYYEQTALGFNYRMSDVQAALGLSQMSRLEEFVSRRRALAERYDTLLKKLSVVTPWQHPDANSSWHLYVIRVKLSGISKTHREVFEAMREAGVGVDLHYIPVHRQPYQEKKRATHAKLPEADRYYAEAMSLPMFPGLTDQQQDSVVEALRKTCDT